DGGTLPLPDGGTDPNTCLNSEDQQFLPGPIRVFPGSIPVGDRPTRMAGVRLLGPNDAPFGAVVVAGLATSSVEAVRQDPLLRLIDANNILSVSKRAEGATLRAPVDVPLPGPAVDVVAPEDPGRRVRVFAVSQVTPA